MVLQVGGLVHTERLVQLEALRRTFKEVNALEEHDDTKEDEARQDTKRMP